MLALEGFTDADFRQTILRALKLLGIVTAAGVLMTLWKFGWQTALLLLVGAGISGSGLWEWLRLMTAVMARMDNGGEAKPMAMLLVGFFLRLGLAVVVLYASLKYLDGSVYALAGGLGLGIFALTVERVRLVKGWAV